MIFLVQHVNVPKSRFEVNLYINLLVVEFITTYFSGETVELSALLLKIHLKLMAGGSAITEHTTLTISPKVVPRI